MKARFILALAALVYSIIYTIFPEFFMKRTQKRLETKAENDRQRTIRAQKKINAKAGLENPPDDEIAPPVEVEPLRTTVKGARTMGIIMIIACAAVVAYCGYQLYIAG